MLVRASKPSTHLVLLPVNESPDLKATPSVWSHATRPLAEAGYYVLPVTLVDETLAQNGIQTELMSNLVYARSEVSLRQAASFCCSGGWPCAGIASSNGTPSSSAAMLSAPRPRRRWLLPTKGALVRSRPGRPGRTGDALPTARSPSLLQTCSANHQCINRGSLV